MFSSFEFDWQMLASLMLVAAAAMIVVRHLIGGIQHAARGTSCGSCNGCSKKTVASQGNSMPLVQLESKRGTTTP